MAEISFYFVQKDDNITKNRINQVNIGFLYSSTERYQPMP